MVRIKDLTKRYENSRGISRLNLRIPRGETRAVIGPSGCGKTTLLHALAGLITTDSGSVEIAADPVRIGLVQQRDSLYPWLTALDNVLLGFKRVNSFQRDEALQLMDEMAVLHTAGQYPASMSGGERQRISLARTLIQKPDLLLLDEPTAALDEFSRESLQDKLLSIQIRNPVTTLFVTHNIEEALFLGQEILVMGEGEIQAVHRSPFYPDPDARDHEHFYSEVLKLRDSLKKAAAP